MTDTNRPQVINKGCFDVDGTLIEKFHYKRHHDDDLELNYYGTTVYARPLLAQIIFLKSCYNRGIHTTVWSANGEIWAREVADKLNIKKFIDEYMDKPIFYVDDKAADEWMKRVMIDEKVQE